MKRRSLLSSRLRHRVRIEKPVLTPDGAGGYTRTWSRLGYAWAQVQEAARSVPAESLRYGKATARARFTLTFRYRNDVTNDMRCILNNRTLNILAVQPDAEKRVIEVLAEETSGG